MSCKGCGTVELNRKLGKCAFCIWFAFVSSVLFWTLAYVLRRIHSSKLIVWPVMAFASLVTLLLVSHLLAFLANRMKR
ncbi:MAG TPA: DUF3624 family protein [Candidatus Acidoferrales bacterium]|nr:DUF3624 family protein [Candidatus Acidoferrales bacterium]